MALISIEELTLQTPVDPRLDEVIDRLGRLQASIDYLAQSLRSLHRKENRMSQDLTALINEVANNKTVIDSTKALIDGLVTQLEAAKDDPEALQAVVDQLKAQNQELADAVIKNTSSPEAPGPTDPTAPSA